MTKQVFGTVASLLVSGLLLASLSLEAETGPRRQEFIHLTKVTVGPYDNFEAFVSHDETSLYFTQSRHLSTHIRKMDFDTGLSTSILDLDADSRSPRISPDGRHVAFTYYRDDAKGDICYSPTAKLVKTCFTTANVTDHSPFWLSPTKIAYLQSNDRGDHSKLLTYDIASKERETLIEGAIYAPNVSEDRSQLVYKGQDNEFIIYDLSRRKTHRSFRIGLPGTTGMAHFSHDGEQLYFAVYILDSNRDLAVDGRDQAAIFRVSLDQEGELLIPEQLSSTDQNCSYPFPSKSKLYMTCAFEGSLDIYKIAHGGVIPSHWGKKELWEAHLTARSYADRLLIINRLKTSLGDLDEKEFFDRSLYNLILMDEWLAASAFAEHIYHGHDGPNQAYYARLSSVLESMARWEVLPNGRVTAEFGRFVDQQNAKLAAESSLPAAEKAVIKAYFDFMLGNKDSARSLLAQQQPSDILYLYLHTRLWRSLNEDLQGALSHLNQLVQKSSLPYETRIYYFSVILELIAASEDPVKNITRLLDLWPSDSVFHQLLQHEHDLYKIGIKSERDELRVVMQGITSRAETLRHDYYAQRLLFNRAMIVLARLNKINQLNDFAGLWLSYTNTSSIEYPYVIEAFRQNTLDTAYRYLYSEEYQNFARGSFFSNIRMSDDLEAHYHFARLNAADDEWERLLTQYDGMLRNELITQDSLEFAKLVRRFYQPAGDLSRKEIEEGLRLCERLSDAQSGSGVKYLVMGYLYQRRLALSIDGFAFDRSDADLAHRSYLLALDLSWNNERIQASAYNNLGLLHMMIRNYSLAAEYMGQRSQMAFEGLSDELALRWIYGNILYRANRFQEAFSQLEQAIRLNPKPLSPWHERAAFYAMNAELFEQSADYYAKFFSELGEGDVSGGIMLSYAYSLDRGAQPDKAQQWYIKAIERSQQEHAGKSKSGAVIYQPIKTRFIAYGLLSQLDLAKAQQIQYLQERLNLYKQLTKNASRYQFGASDLKAQELKDLQRLALIWHESGNAGEAARLMTDSLGKALLYGKDMNFVSRPIQQSLKNVLVYFTWNSPAARSQLIDDRANAIIAGMQEESEKNPQPSPQFVQMLMEARLLMLAYELAPQAESTRRTQFSTRSQELLANPQVADLETSRPELHQTILGYLKNIEAKL